MREKYKITVANESSRSLPIVCEKVCGSRYMEIVTGDGSQRVFDDLSPNAQI